MTSRVFSTIVGQLKNVPTTIAVFSQAVKNSQQVGVSFLKASLSIVEVSLRSFFFFFSQKHRATSAIMTVTDTIYASGKARYTTIFS